MKTVIIGGDAAGMSAAAKLKRNLGDKADIHVFEKGRDVSYAACGIPFFVGGHIQERESLISRTPKEFEEQGVHVHLRHEVTGVDTKEKRVRATNLETGESIERDYDTLIVATGAMPRRIPPMDKAWDNLYVVRDVEDAVAIRQRLDDPSVKHAVVVGAGFIGLEMAEACAKKGKQVLVVEFASQILPAMDPIITDVLASAMERNGVTVRVDSKVVELRGDNGRINAAVVEGKNGREVVPADIVLNCAGIVPNTGFIDVDKSASGAIVVNGRMQTSVRDVYAAGDCTVMTSFITGEHLYAPLGTNANKQGKMIAETLAGKELPPFKLVGSSGLRLFDVDAAKVGLSERDAAHLNLDYKTNMITGNSYAGYYSPEKLTVKLVYGARSRRILGAQLVGQGVVAHRANYFAIAITAEMTVDQFAYLDLIYSPPFSGVWDVTLTAAATAK